MTEISDDFPKEKTDDIITTIRRNVFQRDAYIKEFNKIWDTQQTFYPNVLTDELKNTIENILFFQRQLKSCKHLIANCEFEPNLKVSAKSSPLYQEFVIWQTINNLKINDRFGKEYEITLENKKKLFEILGIMKRNFLINKRD